METNIYSSELDFTYRFLLLGKMGSGKSATGNTLLGNVFFKTGGNLSSCTNVCEVGAARFSRNINIQVIDTPGLCDNTECDDIERAQQIIAKCLFCLEYEPHAILYIVKACERTAQFDETSINNLTKLIGPEGYQYLIVLFTCDDIVDNPVDDTLVELKRMKNNSILNLLRKAGSRFIVFNNRGKDEVRDNQITKLLEITKRLVIINSPETYSYAKSKYMEETCKSIRDDKLKEEIKMEVVRHAAAPAISKAAPVISNPAPVISNPAPNDSGCVLL